jgi:L-ascorbate metabolism protein UlaG (beta-lactamase superfamily)
MHRGWRVYWRPVRSWVGGRVGEEGSMAEPVTGQALVDWIGRQPIPERAVGVWWLGQSSLVLKAAGQIIYIDPYLAPSPRRLVPPAFPPEAVTHADLILCTHDHGDHIDPAALPPLAAASPQARIVAPRPAAGRVAELVGDAERVVAAVADEPLTLGPVEIIPVPAKHEEFERHPELGNPYLGYVLRLDGLTVYNAGDTVAYEGLVERLAPLAIDLAFLPINGRDFFRTSAGTIGNMDYREAAELAIAIGIHSVVPVHYGMFAHNSVPPGYFVSYLAERQPAQQIHILGRYGLYIYARP